jgi:hypothetical protein
MPTGSDVALAMAPWLLEGWEWRTFHHGVVEYGHAKKFDRSVVFLPVTRDHTNGDSLGNLIQDNSLKNLREEAVALGAEPALMYVARLPRLGAFIMLITLQDLEEAARDPNCIWALMIGEGGQKKTGIRIRYPVGRHAGVSSLQAMLEDERVSYLQIGDSLNKGFGSPRAKEAYLDPLATSFSRAFKA